MLDPLGTAKPACSDEPAVSASKLNRGGVLFAARSYGPRRGEPARLLAKEFATCPISCCSGTPIFDNAAYVAGGPDVVRQVRDILPPGWRATLQARDGALIAEVAKQLQRVPADTSHLVVSVGGNDALGEAALLDARVASMAEALELLTSVRDRIPVPPTRSCSTTFSPGLPLTVCTIYEARFAEPVVRRVAATALTMLNDAITREAFGRGVDCIDLRIICDEDSDFRQSNRAIGKGEVRRSQRAILRFAAPGGADARLA